MNDTGLSTPHSAFPFRIGVGEAVKVVIAGGGTGGHLMPALALARALRDARPDVDILLVGAERGIEAQILPRYAYPFRLLPMEPLYRRTWWRNARLPIVAWRVWRAVDRLLDAEQPAVVVGTGRICGGTDGMARAAARCADRAAGAECVSRSRHALAGETRAADPPGISEARGRLAPGRGTDVFTFGNPIRPPEPGDRAGALREMGLDPARRVCWYSAASQGARALNRALAGALEQGLLSMVSVLWGTGTAAEAALAHHAEAGHVVVRGFFDPMADVYRAADLVVCRAGAMTVAELCAWGSRASSCRSHGGRRPPDLQCAGARRRRCRPAAPRERTDPRVASPASCRRWWRIGFDWRRSAPSPATGGTPTRPGRSRQQS